MTKRVPALRIPVDFTSTADFATLRLSTGDDIAPLLGRVIALALAMIQMRRSRLHAAEVDAICAWPGPEPFAEHLAAVGWARRDLTGSLVDVRMPAVLDPFTANRANARIWAERAQRDAKGRYLKSGKPRRPPKRPPGLALNADGNVVEGGGKP